MNEVAPALQIHAINRLYLARALAMAGDTAGAKREYQDLLAFWNDADLIYRRCCRPRRSTEAAIDRTSSGHN